jgi:hypothetical protein
MKQYIEIKADTKDNNITKRTEITDDELRIIDPVIEAIKNFKPYITEDGWNHTHNFPWGEIQEDKSEKDIKQLYVETGLCTDEQILTFVDFCPAGDIYTITDVDLLYIANEEKIL